MTADDIIYDYLKAEMQFLEGQIEEKGELLDFFMQLQKQNDTQFASDQLGMITSDLKDLIDRLLQIRRDSDLISPKTQGVIDRMGNIKPIEREHLLENLKAKYYHQI